MLWLVLGGLTLFALLGGARAFEKASVTTIKSFMAWLAALGGLCLAVLLFLTGRGPLALSGLAMFGPLLWQHWRAANPRQRSRPQTPPRRPSAGLTIDEAWQVLGLQPGADADAIRAAHRRLMRAAHPDGGGSDWLAARINLARDVLLSAQRQR